MVLPFYEGARIARSIIGFKSEKHEVPSYIKDRLIIKIEHCLIKLELAED